MKRPKIHGYDETKIAATPPPANLTRPPVKYTITITVLPKSEAQGQTNVASITADLPEDAQLWIDDYQTRQRGMLWHFHSPPKARLQVPSHGPTGGTEGRMRASVVCRASR
jgi:hypothetical protein